VIRDSFNWPRAQSTLAWESKKQPLKALDSRIPAPASISAAAAAKPDRTRRGISEALPRGISSEIRAEEPQRQTCPARRPRSQRCAKLQKATPIQTSLSLSPSLLNKYKIQKGVLIFTFFRIFAKEVFKLDPKEKRSVFCFSFSFPFPLSAVVNNSDSNSTTKHLIKRTVPFSGTVDCVVFFVRQLVQERATHIEAVEVLARPRLLKQGIHPQTRLASELSKQASKQAAAGLCVGCLLHAPLSGRCRRVFPLRWIPLSLCIGCDR